ncbi:CHC2 zinc finger domain-containing protein [Rhizosphaericola mali]|nr:CHC2 zinc finger domain-containing protein [Rhizosphaericola mali]
MQHEQFNFKAAKEQIDLVDYIFSLGFQYSKQNHHDYWFKSPLHEEHTASFKVDRKRQIWYDHGTGQGGDLIDFIKAFHRCNFKESLIKLQEFQGLNPSTLEVKNKQNIELGNFENADRHIHIISERSIQKYYLIQYIQSRSISISLAEKYLKEVDYSLNGRYYTALGFANNGGGYELRNKYFKGSSMPKAPTILSLSESENDFSQQSLAVFEGFFSMLSFLELLEKDKHFVEKPDSILVLNSLSFLNKSQDLILSFGQIDLYLDGDMAGKKATEQALSWSEKIRDYSHLYEGFKDLNTYLVAQNLQHKEQEDPKISYGLRR